MFIIYIFLVMVVFNFFRFAYLDLKDSYNTVKKREEEQRRKMREAIRLEDEAAERKKEQRRELLKQLDAVKYQIKLLNALDDCLSHDLRDEKTIKKTIAWEKQHNSLWTKERKLLRELDKLDS